MSELLRDRTFGPFFAGKAASSCGVWVQNIAAAVLMHQLTGSAFMVGLVSVVQFAGPLLLALWAGALTDRYDRRKLLMIGKTLSGTPVAALAVLLAVRGVDGFGGPVPLLAGVLVMGIGLALTSPSMKSLVPALVRPADLEQALALSSSTQSIARTIGPALGAGLLLLGGPALAFAGAALGHLTLAAVLLFVRPRPYRRSKQRPKLLGGIRYLVQERAAGMLMIGVAALGLGADAVVTLTPSLVEQFGGGGELVGTMVTSFGIGAVLVTVSIRRLSQLMSLRRRGITGFWVLAAGLAIAAAGVTAPIAALGFLISGAGFMMASVALNTRILRRVPEDVRGRVMALWGVAFLGSRPFAALVNGSLADLASVQVALLAAALLTVTASRLARARFGTPHERPLSPAGTA